MNNLFAILGPTYVQQQYRDEAHPITDSLEEWPNAPFFSDDDENVVAEDQPWPVVTSLCDDMPRDPFRELSGDEE